MQSELTNLLPAKAIRYLRRGYFLRLANVCVLFIVLLIIIHGILLFPAYQYAKGQVTQEQARLDDISQKAQASDETGVNARIASVKSDITYLARLDSIPTASAAVKGVVTVPHRGVHLSGFTFTAPVTASSSPTMTLTGMADTRDQLRSYNLALGELPYVSNADLPISAYAKESDIPFTITLTGTLTPMKN